MSISSAKLHLRAQMKERMKKEAADLSKLKVDQTASLYTQLSRCILSPYRGAPNGRDSPLVTQESVRSVLLFASLSNEFATRPLFESLKDQAAVYFPACVGDSLQFHRVLEWDSLQSSRYSLEPAIAGSPWIPGDQDSIVILPGLAFSVVGGRLGRGRGFYDRFLSQHPNLRRMGLGFTSQVLRSLPLDPHDQPIDAILCPQGLWICPSRML